MVLLAATLLAAPQASGDRVECSPGEELEVVTYYWRLKGFLSFIAGFRFPTNGTGTLATLYKNGKEVADTELRIITDEAKGDRYRYRSVIDLTKNRTIESVDGYDFEGRTKVDTTTLDYEKHKARRARIDTKRGEGETIHFSDFTGDNVKDVLTSIHHIRKSMGEIKEPQRQDVFAGGKVYPVLITPGKTKAFIFKGRKVEGRLYTITATPENRDRWPGDVEVWITTDEDRIPIEIDLGKSMASLHLQAVARFTCP